VPLNVLYTLISQYMHNHPSAPNHNIMLQCLPTSAYSTSRVTISFTMF